MDSLGFHFQKQTGRLVQGLKRLLSGGTEPELAVLRSGVSTGSSSETQEERGCLSIQH